MTDTLINPVGINYPSRPPGLGRVFYVSHTSGANTNNGLVPDTAFHDVTEALTHCENWRNDYIYVLDSTDGEPLYPVAVGVHAVHIIGLGVTGGAPGMDQTSFRGGGNNCMTLTAQRAEIAGFLFTSAAAVGIDCPSAYRSWIHHCGFGVGGWPLDTGIYGEPDGLGHGLIEDNFFGNGFYGGVIIVYGIHGDFTNVTIRRNVFRGLSTHCISTDTEVGAIYENYFFGWIADHPLGNGWAIDLTAGTQGGMLTNNHAMQTGDGTGSNPYRDLTSPGDITAIKNGWGMNYSGQAVIAPAIN